MSARLSHQRVLPYPIDQVWPAAVRYLRVDRGYTIVDRDAEAGYILFDFDVGGRTARGSVEAFATTDVAGRTAATVKVSTEAGPAHLPQTLVDGLQQKLRTDYGHPAPPPAPDEPKPPKKKPPKAPVDPPIDAPDGPGDPDGPPDGPPDGADPPTIEL